MEQLATPEIIKTPTTDHTPMSELTNYHKQIEKKYRDVNPDTVPVNPDATVLMPFNGYYTLDTAAGAFFAVDTNMHIKADSPTPIYIVDLLISLDGKNSERYEFTGTFDGKQLLQGSVLTDELYVDLNFTRTDLTNGSTAVCSGSIALPNSNKVTVNGSTYNNLIPATIFAGDYYEAVPLYINGNQEKVVLKVLKIQDDFQIMYDDGSNNEQLQPLTHYTYNMNMYFFSSTNKENNVTTSLIMGTAAAGGLACNNIITAGTKSTTRSLQTIASPDMAPAPGILDYNANSSLLAPFSGYYPLPSIADKAFMSVQAQYANAIGDDYVVMISISMDGITSKGYYFDNTMTFENGMLSMPDQSITLTFNRQFNLSNGSGTLVSISGTINNTAVTGSTSFNPVPLSVFGGVPMSTDTGIQLTVVNNNEVIYKGTKITTDMKNILYVPLMYILAYPAENPTTVMSFGTDGLKGNTCIITDNNGMYVVSAILPKAKP